MARTLPQDNQPQVTTDGTDASLPAESASSQTAAPAFFGVKLSSFQRLLLGLAAVGLVTVVAILSWGPGMNFPTLSWNADMQSPKDVGREIDVRVQTSVKWMAREGAWLSDGIKTVILKVLLNLEEALLWLPWPALMAGIALLAWRLAGWRVAIFSVLALLSIGIVGLWASAMETLALVFTSVVLSVAIGVPLGVLGARSSVADAVMRPVLDGMQTMPTFVYLVPAIMFFSLGNVPAVMATILYSLPPSIRLTNLGIRQVSPETLEAARSFGTTPMQLLLKVQIPMALPTIMAGINQTIMMAMAMVVIGAMVSAGGLGEDVLRALGRREPGNAALAGFSIVFIGIIIDRVTQALAKGQQEALAGSSR